MATADYKFTGNDFKITDKMLSDFKDCGYLVLRNLMSAEEVKKINEALLNDGYMNHAYGVPDGKGREARLVTWSYPGQDILGMVARSEKVVGSVEKLLEGEVYHYYSKVIMKPAQIGGKLIWHQDYGYWYTNGNLFPNLITVWIALDKVTKTNSCVKVLRGSNKSGRLDHFMQGGQMGCDPERVEHIAKSCPLEYVEMEAGDCLFIGCNIIHASDDNESGKRRWALACVYNRADNDPIKDHHYPHYNPLHKVADSEILNCTNKSLEGKSFLDVEKRAKDENKPWGHHIGDVPASGIVNLEIILKKNFDEGHFLGTGGYAKQIIALIAAKERFHPRKYCVINLPIVDTITSKEPSKVALDRCIFQFNN